VVFSTDGFDISFPFLSLGDESIRVEEKTRDKISILFLSLSRAGSRFAAQEKGMKSCPSTAILLHPFLSGPKGLKMEKIWW